MVILFLTYITISFSVRSETQPNILEEPSSDINVTNPSLDKVQLFTFFLWFTSLVSAMVSYGSSDRQFCSILIPTCCCLNFQTISEWFSWISRVNSSSAESVSYYFPVECLTVTPYSIHYTVTLYSNTIQYTHTL